MRHALVATAAATLLVACAAPPVAEVTQPLAKPPAALTMQGIPPVPATLPARVGRYTEFKGAGLLDWSPDGKALLVTYLRDSRTQLHTASGVGQPLRPLTASAEPTRAGAFLPSDPAIVLFERDVGGSEASRVFRLDTRTGVETPLTDEKRRCDMGPFSMSGTANLVYCAPLDRNVGGNAERAGGVTVDFALIDVMSGNTRAAAAMKGPGWFPIDISPDERSALLLRFRSRSDAEVWVLDLTTGAPRRLLPREGEAPGFYVGVGFAPDGRRLFVVTDRNGEFNRLYRYDPATHAFEGVTTDIPWDVESVTLTRDRKRLALVTNENGLGVPRVYDAATLQPVAVPRQPGVNVTSALIAPDGTRLAIAGSSATAPSEVRVIDLAAQRAALWAAADKAGMDTSAFQPKEVIEWKSFDGRTISGLIQRPPARFTGKRPVLIEIHGGPAAQSQADFSGRFNYVINEMGIALIEPNVRGSTGFGKTFQTLDDGKLREDSLKDIGALLDWIATQPDLDASRVVVQGGSYGGYMASAVAVRYPDRIRGAMTAVGISNFVTFLERTESYRRDLRRTEYGDERDPDMRAFLLAISPLTNADKIKTPLFVIHGRNDPRVPVQEAEQIAATVAKNGVPVWVMIAENEGHGFGKKENADYLFYARVLFLEKFLLADKPAR
jgi:dipeptidyl aminopeptidase/acylaminoacyl peptidase